MPDPLEIFLSGPVSQGVQQVEDQPFEKYWRCLRDSIQQFSRNGTVDLRERGIKPFIGSLLCGGCTDVGSIIVAAIQGPRCEPLLANELPRGLVVKSVRMARKEIAAAGGNPPNTPGWVLDITRRFEHAKTEATAMSVA